MKPQHFPQTDLDYQGHRHGGGCFAPAVLLICLIMVALFSCNKPKDLCISTYYDVMIRNGRDTASYKQKDKEWVIKDTIATIEALVKTIKDQNEQLQKLSKQTIISPPENKTL